MEEADGAAAAADRDGGARRPSDHSSALAEKLLQGWALLQEHCPQCLTPLVRNRQRKMFCVACAQWVVTQSEVAEQGPRLPVEETHKNEGFAQTYQPSPQLGSANQGHQDITPASTSVERDRPKEGCSLNADDPNARGTPENRSSESARVVPKINAASKTVEEVLPNILSILVCKLEELGSALSASQNLDDMRMLFSALRECLQAITDVKAIAE